MFDVYAWNTPNGQKVLIALEEAEADYRYHAIDITEGEQHTDEFTALSPDQKIPALIHHTSHQITLFESGAILLYLADQFPSLHAATEPERARVVSWVFWQVGQLGPLVGQFGRFRRESPHNAIAIHHFEALTWRCLHVMECHLRQSPYLGSDRFTIADIACLPWVASQQSYLQRYELEWQDTCPALARWSEHLLQRPSVRMAMRA